MTNFSLRVCLEQMTDVPHPLRVIVQLFRWAQLEVAFAGVNAASRLVAEGNHPAIGSRLLEITGSAQRTAETGVLLLCLGRQCASRRGAEVPAQGDRS